MDINKTKGDDRQVMRDDASNGFLVIMVHSRKQKQYRRNQKGQIKMHFGYWVCEFSPEKELFQQETEKKWMKNDTAQ